MTPLHEVTRHTTTVKLDEDAEFHRADLRDSVGVAERPPSARRSAGNVSDRPDQQRPTSSQLLGMSRQLPTTLPDIQPILEEPEERELSAVISAATGAAISQPGKQARARRRRQQGQGLDALSRLYSGLDGAITLGRTKKLIDAARTTAEE